MYKELRKNNINTMGDLHDGRGYIGANLGLNSAGTSARAVMQHDKYMNSAVIFEQMMRESVDRI